MDDRGNASLDTVGTSPAHRPAYQIQLRPPLLARHAKAYFTALAARDPSRLPLSLIRDPDSAVANSSRS